MPKVISRSIVVTDQDARIDDVGGLEVPLTVYYCLCGHLALILDTKLEALPKRKRDGAAVIQRKQHYHKLTFEEGPVKKVKRSEGGCERQKRLVCKNCQLPLFYEPGQKSEYAEPDRTYIYVIPGSVYTNRENIQEKYRESSFKQTHGKNAVAPTVTHTARGKFGTTTVGTAEDEENEQVWKSLDQSYAENATIIQRQLQAAKKNMKRPGDEAEEKPPEELPKRVKRGTLLT
ncbi:hypothetical protein SARC_01515 [Sphaeroforma arctica JP610]|uniref:STEEP1 domain-containing protein n=1 Tax=Sphaeroforma arctica JP610 TaxID=667725 RepID=A0A0L0GBQ1_9EUKA|nr:hypothetical protein SARC_01515 [Sphaeroforma arctica JP610]KNC86321.1 hypothetical protein SARC_01515 [Sphaeroforma arctica JP610]|eukprot:XP_014160223.1 hypothetical protein SARC_01515 [Sphaeroforma arctica JP610]